MNSNTIKVEEIGFRFAEKALRGNKYRHSERTLTGFVLSNHKMLFPDSANTKLSDEQLHNLTVEYLKRMWPPDSTSVVTITNVSMDSKREGLYLVKPPLEGAVTAGYGTDRGIVGFQCVLHQDGYFLVIGIEHGFYADAGPDDLQLTGPVYMQLPPAPGKVLEKTRPPKALADSVLKRIANLRSRRLFVADHVKNWSEFLDWKNELVHGRQLSCRYDSVEVDEAARCLRFSVSNSFEQWQRFSKIRSFPVCSMPLSASKDSANN